MTYSRAIEVALGIAALVVFALILAYNGTPMLVVHTLEGLCRS
jgi:hypothetical protein